MEQIEHCTALITEESLLAAGYKRFTQNNLWQFTNVGWQKRFCDTKGKKYFITIAEYDNSAYPDLYRMCGARSYQPEVQFVSNNVTFDVQMHQPESIEQVEAFFENMWYSLGC